MIALTAGGSRCHVLGVPIDRKRFLALAMTLAFGGCGPKGAPADPGRGAGGSGGAGPTGDAGDAPTEEAAAPPEECVDWDAAGECTETAIDEGMYPAAECLDWDASGECIQHDAHD